MKKEGKDLGKHNSYERVESWEKLRPLFESSFKKGDYKTAARVLEGHYNATERMNSPVGRSIGSSRNFQTLHHNGKVVVGTDALATCYELLGEMEKAGKRYEKINEPYYAAVNYEKAGDINKAKGLYEAAIEKHGKMGIGHFPFFVQESRKRLREIEKVEKEKQEGIMRKHSGLENATASTALVSIIIGTALLIPKVTGNAIGNSNSYSNILGAVLLVTGLIAGFLWIRKK